MKDDRLYLIHITESIARIEEYVRGGREEFFSSPIIQDAVIRNLQTLAESTQRLSADLKAHHTAVDWRGIAGLRNVLVHDYLGVDIERVWQMVERKVPALRDATTAMLGQLGGSADGVSS
jgi:uncharacterized protein with HEPN domain